MDAQCGSTQTTSAEVLRGKRVLIVEDETIILLQLARTVEKAGMVVAGVTRSAEDAMRLVRSEMPDIVLMDVGLQLARQADAQFIWTLGLELNT